MDSRIAAAKALGYSTLEDASRALGVSANSLLSSVNPTQTLPSYNSPSPSSSSNTLLNFKNTADAVVNLGRQKRNATMLDFMKPFSGTVAASDFSSILNSMNSASDTYSSDVLDNAQESAGLGGKPITSGNLTLAPDETSEMYNILKTGKTQSGTVYGNPTGADGFVDPAVYLKLLDTWRQNQGLLEDFLQIFPTETFINPKNTWVGEQLKQRGVKFGEASGSSSGDFTPTEKRRLEQAGLIGAPRQTQLDFLYGDQDELSSLRRQ